MIENIRAELTQCIDWAEYANDFCADTSYYDAKIQPLDSENFEVTEITALFHYCQHCNITIDKLVIVRAVDNIWLVWLSHNDHILGDGLTMLDAVNSFLGYVESWYAQNCTKLQEKPNKFQKVFHYTDLFCVVGYILIVVNKTR